MYLYSCELCSLSFKRTSHVTRLTQRVPLVEKELPTLPYCKVGSCYSFFSFMCMFCRSLFVLFSFGHCVVCSSLCCLFFIVLSVLHCVVCSSLCCLFFIVLSVLHCVVCSSLFCLSFDLWLLVTPFVSSNSS